jgi:hypothetical protein
MGTLPHDNDLQACSWNGITQSALSSIQSNASEIATCKTGHAMLFAFGASSAPRLSKCMGQKITALCASMGTCCSGTWVMTKAKSLSPTDHEWRRHSSHTPNQELVNLIRQQFAQSYVLNPSHSSSCWNKVGVRADAVPACRSRHPRRLECEQGVRVKALRKALSRAGWERQEARSLSNPSLIRMRARV